MKPFYFQMECKSAEDMGNGECKIKGFASTPDLDRQYDIVLPTAFQKSLENYYNSLDGDGNPSSPALLRSHDECCVVGKILMDGEDAPVISSKGLFITALVTEPECAKQVMAGELRTLSIGYMPMAGSVEYQWRPTGKFMPDGQELQIECRILKEVDWIEASIVSTPANPKAIFTVEKSVKKYFSSFPSPTMKNMCNFCEEKQQAVGKIGSRHICAKCIDKMEFKGEVAKKLEGKTVGAITFAKENFSKSEAKRICTTKGFAIEKMQETENAYVFPQGELKSIENLDAVDTDVEGCKLIMVKEVEEETPEQKAEREAKETADAAAAAEAASTTASTSETAETAAESTAAETTTEEVVANGGEEASAEGTEEQKAFITELTKALGITETKEAAPVATETKTAPVETKGLELLMPILRKMAEMIRTLNDATAEVQESMKKIPMAKGKTILSFQHALVNLGTKKTGEETKQETKDVGFAAMLEEARGGKVVIGSDEDDQ